MLTRDEVVQLIFSLILATALLLASRVRAAAVEDGGRNTTMPDHAYVITAGPIN